ncbi:hypothetical protein CY0110_18687 [Crocosphaera chwakensis CCY0110]|uniref:Uncharacterized protein n=1 Tax=Crocosphaera chwakensis CCY0110 TaxID=391612 RepID=A3IJ69_9CHRO|nr:hypothetical protein CY0110_18687 [Crocosphaera chwakensis CCY0110]
MIKIRILLEFSYVKLIDLIMLLLGGVVGEFLNKKQCDYSHFSLSLNWYVVVN